MKKKTQKDKAPYGDAPELAETATRAVRFHIAHGQPEAAAALQSFAAVAWGVAFGEEPAASGIAAAERALESLRRIAGVDGARRFLADATRALRALADAEALV